MARYAFRRLGRLPATEEGLARYTVLNAPGTLAGLEVRHAVLRPGADVPIQAVAGQGTLVFTLSGRGIMLIDGDRVEVGANDLVYVQAGCPYALKTLGTSDWVYVTVRGGA
jgi:mannose-6-phosphate isomerase-like protein (cupin superfamily)